MNDDPLETVLRHLHDGNIEAAERVYAAYEPDLRRLVRKRLPDKLRAKFDSVDIVQSIFADLLHGFQEHRWEFADEKRLWAFLAKATRNRLIDRTRQHRTAAEKEQPLSDDTDVHAEKHDTPLPSEVAEADELWQHLLALCPAEHRQLLCLKRDGHSAAEIAARTGFHEGSVRRILRNLANQLAVEQKRIACARKA